MSGSEISSISAFIILSIASQLKYGALNFSDISDNSQMSHFKYKS